MSKQANIVRASAALPLDLWHRAQRVKAERRCSLQDLIVEGLRAVVGGKADVRIVCPDCDGKKGAVCDLCEGAGIVLATAAPDPPPFDSYGPEHPRPDREDP